MNPPRRLALPCVREDIPSLLAFLDDARERMHTTVLLPAELVDRVPAAGPAVATEGYTGSPRVTTTFDECCLFRDTIALRSARLGRLALASGAHRFRVFGPFDEVVWDRPTLRKAIVRTRLLLPWRGLVRATQFVLRLVWSGRLDRWAYATLARLARRRRPGPARPDSIHFVIASAGLGGTQRQLAGLVRELTGRGYRCKVWLVIPDDAFFTRALVDAGAAPESIWTAAGSFGPWLRLVWRACSARSHVVVALALALALRRDRPTVLQCLLDMTNVAGALGGRLAGVPVVAAGLRSLHPDAKVGTSPGPFERECYRLLDPSLVDAIVANSEAGAIDFAQRHPGALAAKLRVVRNGVVHAAPVAAGAPSFPPGLHPDAPLVAWVGRLIPGKRLDVFLRACRALADAPFHAVVVGDGPLRAESHTLAADLGLAGRVSFLGVREDAGDIMRASRVVALTSDFEGFPNVVLEAQSLGRPVVATCVGDVAEIVADGVTGFVVNAGDVEAVADRLRRLLHDPERARRMGEAGALRVREHFTASRMADETLDVYRRAAVARGVTLRPAES